MRGACSSDARRREELLTGYFDDLYLPIKPACEARNLLGAPRLRLRASQACKMRLKMRGACSSDARRREELLTGYFDDLYLPIKPVCEAQNLLGAPRPRLRASQTRNLRLTT